MKKCFKIFLVLFCILSMTGCKKYYVSEDDIKSINEIELTILEKLSNTYDVGFELEFVSLEDYKICEFYLHECLSYSDVEGAKKYTYDGISEEGYIFTVTYSDPYYDDKDNFNEEEIVENYLKEKENISSDYHIRYYDDAIPGASYNLKLAKTGSYTLYASIYSSTEDMETSYYKYESNLDKTTTEKVVEILDYIKEKENISHDIYEFYYDNELQRSKMTFEYEGYIKQIIYALKSISVDEKIEAMSSEEYGIKIINDLYTSIFDEDNEGEKLSE